jgi:hypothetical protein
VYLDAGLLMAQRPLPVSGTQKTIHSTDRFVGVEGTAVIIDGQHHDQRLDCAGLNG